MAITFEQLTGSGQLTGSAATYYTSTKIRTVVTKASAFNANAAAQTVDIWVVETGGSAADTNKIIEGKVIQPNETVVLSELEGHVLPVDSTLQAAASATTSITLTVSGFKVS